MEISGKLYKDGKFWLIEVPLLNATTQGKTQKEAIMMIKDLIQEMIISYFPNKVDPSFVVTTNLHKNGALGISTTDNNLIYALSLRRQREMSGSTVRDASKRLGSSSPNAYAQYERGMMRISIEKYDRLLTAANPTQHAVLGVA